MGPQGRYPKLMVRPPCRRSSEPEIRSRLEFLDVSYKLACILVEKLVACKVRLAAAGSPRSIVSSKLSPDSLCFLKPCNIRLQE